MPPANSVTPSVFKWAVLLAVVVLLPAMSGASVPAQPGAEARGTAVGGADDPEGEYKALEAMPMTRVASFAEMQNIDIRSLYERNKRIHAEIWKYLERYPNHPRRWDAMMLLSLSTGFQKEAEIDGRKVMVRDTEAEKAWYLRFRAMVEELLVAPDAGAAARQKALSWMINVTSNQITRKVISDPTAEMAKLNVWFDDMEQHYSDTSDYVSACRAYARALDVVDPQACVEFLIRLKLDHPADGRVNSELALGHTKEAIAAALSKDAQLNDIAEKHLGLMRSQANSVTWKFDAFGGGSIDVASLRGKVVLLMICRLMSNDGTSLSEQPLLAQLYRTYHGQGLEIIQVASEFRYRLGKKEAPGSDFQNKAQYEQYQKMAKASSDAESLINQAALPWPVVLNENGSNGFSTSLGINFTPAWVILAKDGSLFMSPVGMSPESLGQNVRRALGLAGVAETTPGG